MAINLFENDKQFNENIGYVRQMLGELRSISSANGAELLSYMLEMAYVEAGDIQAGARPLSIRKSDGNRAVGMSGKTTR